MKTKNVEYKDVCFECGDALYGKAKREIGGITIHMGICEECGKEKAIVPAIDWENARKPIYTSFDMD